MSYLGTGFGLAAALYFLIWFAWPSTVKPGTTPPRSVALVVLGDIGRSPRMLYHAQSFASAGFKTYILAYKGMPLPPCHPSGARAAPACAASHPLTPSRTLRRFDPIARADRNAPGRVCVLADTVGMGRRTAEGVVPGVRAVESGGGGVGFAVRAAVAGQGCAGVCVCAGKQLFAFCHCDGRIFEEASS